MPFKRMLETISHISFVSMKIVNKGGTIYLRVKCPPPPQPSCMFSLLCNDRTDCEGPGHLKFLNALQEDTGNNFSYLVPMNIVNGGWGVGWGWGFRQSTPG